MNMFAGLHMNSMVVGIGIETQKLTSHRSPAAVPRNLLLCFYKVCPSRSGLFVGIPEHLRSRAGQGGVNIRGGGRGGGGPARLTTRPKAVQVRIEGRSAKGFGETVSGVELTLVERHRPLAHELLHP